MPFPESIARLPQWAQRHIAVLEQENDRLHRAIDGGLPGSDTFLGGPPDLPLGVGVRIRFEAGPPGEQVRLRYIDAHLVRDSDRPESGVQSLDINASYPIVVAPQAANRVLVRFIR